MYAASTGSPSIRREVYVPGARGRIASEQRLPLELFDETRPVGLMRTDGLPSVVSMTAHPLALLLLAGCAVLGSLLFAEFETDADQRAPAAEVSSPPSSAGALRIDAASIEEQVETVLARPLFSPSRRPADMPAGNLTADLGLERLRLAGIITAPGRRLAIFADTDGKPLAVAEGQSVKGWQIESITPRRVSLSAAGGIVNLRPQSSSASADPAAPPKLTFDRVLPDQQTRDDE